MSAATDRLIATLAADLRPVARLRPPWMRAAGWLAVVVAVALGLAGFADLGGLAARLGAVPDMGLAVLGSVTTTLLGAVAAFELSLPDRRSAWALLPLPGLALWIGASGMGCLRSVGIPGIEPQPMVEMGHCLGFIVGLSIPLSILMILMIRRACPLRPGLTALVGGMAAAAAAATLLNFFHPYDASALDLSVHAVAVGLVILVNRAGGRAPARAVATARAIRGMTARGRGVRAVSVRWGTGRMRELQGRVALIVGAGPASAPRWRGN